MEKNLEAAGSSKQAELTTVKALHKQQKIVAKQAMKNIALLNRLKMSKKKSITKLTTQVKAAAPRSQKKKAKNAALKQAKTELKRLQDQDKQAKQRAAAEQQILKSYARSQTRLEKTLKNIEASKSAKKTRIGVKKQKNSDQTMKNVAARNNAAANKSSQDNEAMSNSWFS